LLQQVHGENPAENSVLYNSIKNKVQFIHGCITNEQLLKEAIQKANIIVHFVAETGTDNQCTKLKMTTCKHSRLHYCYSIGKRATQCKKVVVA
jgi:nucleoside-diphosphate-sugar epimerase